MKLIAPPFVKGQGFGENAADVYRNSGLLGHPAIDYGGTQDYGKAVPNSCDGAFVSAILSKDSPNLEAYRAVNTIYEDGTGCYEIQYGHLVDVNVRVGDILMVGNKIGTLGNTGQVYGGNPFHLITHNEKAAGSREGSHVHFQVRSIKKVSENDSNYAHYLNDGSGRLVFNRFSYAVPNFNNGYNGCLNPEQFYNPVHFQFNKNLYFGMNDLDVIELQRRLAVSPTDLRFGPKTFKAVVEWQKAHGISATGFVGPITRASLNK